MLSAHASSPTFGLFVKTEVCADGKEPEAAAWQVICSIHYEMKWQNSDDERLQHVDQSPFAKAG